MGLKVDTVVQGMGTSNTGNVARRFFKNPEKVSGITGVDVRLIHRCSIILAVISSGHEINYERLRSQFKVSSTKLPPDAIYLLNIESTEDYESNEEAESNSD